MVRNNFHIDLISIAVSDAFHLCLGSPSINLDKNAVTDDGLAPHDGTIIKYTYVVKNVGTDDAVGVKLYDNRTYPAPSGSKVVIDLGTIPINSLKTYIESYTVTEADCCNLTSLRNDAKASVLWNNIYCNSTIKIVTVAISLRTDISLTKSSSSNPYSLARVGDIVTYNYSVKNTGTITVRGVTVVDDPLGNVALNTTVLAPGKVAEGYILKTITNREFRKTYLNRKL